MLHLLFTRFSLLVLFSIGCGKLDTVTGFTGDPTVPLPIEQGTYCEPSSDGSFKNTFSVSTRPRSGGGWRGEGGGCLTANIDDVWAGAREQNIFHWNDSTATKVLNRTDNLPPGIVYFYEAVTEVDDVIDVKWTMYWLHSVAKSDERGVAEIVINYEKVAGTRFIQHWKGSIVLKRLSDTVTEYLHVNQIQAERTSDAEARDAIREVYDEVLVNSNAGNGPDVPGPIPGFDGKPDEALAFDHDDYCQDGDEKFNVSVSKRDKGGFRAEGGGCLKSNILDAHESSLQKAIYTWKTATETKILERDKLPAGTTHFFDVESKDKGILRTKLWNTFWFHSIQALNGPIPGSLLINFQKVKGSEKIKYWKGSILLEWVSDNLTQFRMVNLYNSTGLFIKEKSKKHVEEIYLDIQEGLKEPKSSPNEMELSIFSF